MLEPPDGGWSAPQIYLIEAQVLLLLLLDVLPDDGFVSPYRRDEVSPRPEVAPAYDRPLPARSSAGGIPAHKGGASSTSWTPKLKQMGVDETASTSLWTSRTLLMLAGGE